MLVYIRAGRQQECVSSVHMCFWYKVDLGEKLALWNGAGQPRGYAMEKSFALFLVFCGFFFWYVLARIWKKYK